MLTLGIHIVQDGNLVEYQKIPVKKEEEIEEFIENHPSILEKDMFIIGRQVETLQKTRIDLLGLDKEGNLIIIELKKDQTPRDVVSQILEYAAWAEKIQYEELNKIAKEKHLGDYSDLYKKYEIEFDSVPEIFNESQKLIIVSEIFDEKTKNVARYLKTRAIDINCIELNFYENKGQKLADTRVVVGNEKIIVEDYTKEGKKKKLSWEEKLQVATEENAKNVTDLIELILKKFNCISEPDESWNYFYTKESEKNEDIFAVILCGKRTANIALRIDPTTFDIKDEEVREVKGWWFKDKDGERRISILPENFELILKCLEHAYERTRSK